MTDPRIDYFQTLAETWDAEEPSSETMTAGVAARAELLALSPGESLLEVGCGTGKLTGWLVEQVSPGRVTAVDFAPGMIGRARVKGLGADFQIGDLCRDPLPEQAYDVALCFHVFPHFRDQPGAARNLAAAVKPTGRLIVMHLASAERINAFHARLDGAVHGDVMPVAREEWGELLSPAGLVIEDYRNEEDLFFLRARRGSRT
jgi:ubiquinone/menaquinone biosynthesis C-methylase UbiE